MIFSKYKNDIEYLLPSLAIIDLLIINLLAYYFNFKLLTPILFSIYISVMWIVLSVKNDFYSSKCYSNLLQLARATLDQFILFFVALYAFIGFFKEPNVARLGFGEFYLTLFLCISITKILTFYFIKAYKSRNAVNVIIIGKNKKTDQLIKIFNQRIDYGYRVLKQFNIKSFFSQEEDCFDYIIKNNIKEIYCSVSELSDEQITKLINFADNNLRTLKFIPDNKHIFEKKLKFEYYDYVPVLYIRDIPLKSIVNHFSKRIFDIFFSLIVIIGLLSWLTPLMAILIKLESKGPIFFKQMRYGNDYDLFACYKFRSMGMNKDSDKEQATKGDMRVTKVGRFIRKTSIDELPQFYNVLLGNMSVVGPRPLLMSHTTGYRGKIDKFMVRYTIKPGITGLAQVNGYRGEIEKDSDMQNRIRYDIFYVENWSMMLDVKIIVQTIMNVFKGEEKAY
ncbi:exopolysaccharide biosynthesis polyprenyl glycosylphosphotransferase [Galbibacter sp. EGI 63066]|uniref:exopolysaccharide biosynthesis polyprenyl glycosylphosphotransferase n=1 Tax=Galbibacter sp. EGI 63066 TaxID=2993559 RepID=UPI00224885A4|nr:exopolysaccharide biosynthesis polyprenyl glycosylphosphotransferase [Galbibacter sp. EGI 63066]MCX2680674.1 exopolysaccharide biosynthesis polyprenyl glycosylphosphotransferase [Galbibacter sp. EGI 63066]